MALGDWASNTLLKGLRPSTALEAPLTRHERPEDLTQSGASTDSPTKQQFDLKALNPSLFVVGIATIEAMLPRYRAKAGLACERMQHAGMPVDVIRSLLEAVFVVPVGETQQSEAALRAAFTIFDSSGDGSIDKDEFLAILPLLGESVPPEVVDQLFDLVDHDRGATVDAPEFVFFVRKANPVDEAAPEGWCAFLPESSAQFEEMVLLHIGDRRRAHERNDGRAWRIIPPSELELVRRSSGAAWSTSIVIARADLPNAEAVISGLRALGFKNDEIHAVARAIFVTQTDEDFARVFQVFDRDATGGIDPFEFRATMALLGAHSTEGEARELFLDADTDNDGVLNVNEFTELLRRISPKSQAASEAYMIREAIARERLQERIASVDETQADPSKAEAMLQILVLGASKTGKTYLLNQVLADKLPKGTSVSVGVGALITRLGLHDVAVQVLDTPGDARFAPLGQVFYGMTWGCLLMYDVTSFDSFEALQPLLDGYLAANPTCDPVSQICLVANEARIGMQHAVSPGYALEWCEANGDIPFFEVDPEAPQGILEPLRYLVDEYITTNPIGGRSVSPTLPHAAHTVGASAAWPRSSFETMGSSMRKGVGRKSREAPGQAAAEGAMGGSSKSRDLKETKRATFAPEVFDIRML